MMTQTAVPRYLCVCVCVCLCVSVCVCATDATNCG